MTLSLIDKENNVFRTTTSQGQKGFNEYRWDMIVKKEESNKPYFVHYDQYLEESNYTLVLSDGTRELKQIFVVKDGVFSLK
ncbi:MAG: hypothetical protein IPM42_11360 [Saprospiraceae bacterium]|nr:hypothetical protein [Saprospiraceae bacterium]